MYKPFLAKDVPRLQDWGFGREVTTCLPISVGGAVAARSESASTNLVPSRASISGAYTFVSLNLRLKDLIGPVTRVKKQKKKNQPVGIRGLNDCKNSMNSAVKLVKFPNNGR